MPRPFFRYQCVWLALLSVSFCALVLPASAYTFSGSNPLTISLNKKTILKVESQFCTAISGLRGYVVATPALLEQEKLQVYLHNETRPRLISLKGHFMNAVTSASYDAKSKTLKLVGHINPQVSLGIEYSLASGKTKFKELR